MSCNEAFGVIVLIFARAICGNGIGGIHENYIVADLVYAIPRNSVFLGALYTKHMLTFRNDKCKDASAGKVDLNVTYTPKAAAGADVYNLLSAKLGKGYRTDAHIRG